MGRFFIQTTARVDDFITIAGADAAHLARVLRAQVGQELTVCDPEQKEYRCKITKITKETVTALVLGEAENDTEPSYRAILYQGLPKGDKMETIIQKAVECGVYEIVPFAGEHCVVKLDAVSAKKKQERWQKIAESAAKQSGRGRVPTVRLPISYAQAVEEAAKSQVGFLCYEGERQYLLGQLLPSDAEEISFLIGPEGGFSKKEVTLAQEAGLPCVGLGKRILRTETASTFVLSALVYRYELEDISKKIQETP